MEMRRMVRRRLLAAKAAAAVPVLISMLVLSTHLASNSGSLSASMAPEVFCAKKSSYGSELHARNSCEAPDLCGDPGTANAVRSYTSNSSSMLHAKSFRPSVTDLVDQLLTNDDCIGKEGFACSFLTKKGIKEDRQNPYNNQTEYSKALSKGSKNGGGSATVDEIPYFRSDEYSKTYRMPAHIPILYRTRAPGSVAMPSSMSASVDDPIPSQRPVEMSGASVGDMTITVDRSRDTTVDCGLSCSSLAPAHNDSKPPIQWIFLKPLTKELWLATVCFIFFTGFVFWMIERSINPVFQGSSSAQFGTALDLVFSTLTFSHGQILRSPLSKIVLVVWCFVVLIVTQCYVANLTSMLATEASANNVSSSAAGWAPLTLRSFSGLFVVTGCIFAFMLLISLTRSAYAAYTRVRGSESQSTPQSDAANGSAVIDVSEQDEAAGAMQDSMSDATEPAPDVRIQIDD